MALSNQSPLDQALSRIIGTPGYTSQHPGQAPIRYGYTPGTIGTTLGETPVQKQVKMMTHPEAMAAHEQWKTAFNAPDAPWRIAHDQWLAASEARTAASHPWNSATQETSSRLLTLLPVAVLRLPVQEINGFD